MTRCGRVGGGGGKEGAVTRPSKRGWRLYRKGRVNKGVMEWKLMEEGGES